MPSTKHHGLDVLVSAYGGGASVPLFLAIAREAVEERRGGVARVSRNIPGLTQVFHEASPEICELLHYAPLVAFLAARSGLWCGWPQRDGIEVSVMHVLPMLTSMVSGQVGATRWTD